MFTLETDPKRWEDENRPRERERERERETSAKIGEIRRIDRQRLDDL